MCCSVVSCSFSLATHRYAVGAIRNLAVSKRGREMILNQAGTMPALEMMCGSADKTAATYAQAAIDNLNVTKKVCWCL